MQKYMFAPAVLTPPPPPQPPSRQLYFFFNSSLHRLSLLAAKTLTREFHATLVRSVCYQQAHGVDVLNIPSRSATVTRFKKTHGHQQKANHWAGNDHGHGWESNKSIRTCLATNAKATLEKSRQLYDYLAYLAHARHVFVIECHSLDS
jgi:hypothetical protein